MKPPIYLSIDLDYWCQEETPDECRAFFEQVFALKQPIMVAMAHHHLLLDIEAAGQDGCTELWNVDWHSDLCEEEPPSMLNAGTWGALVSWRSWGIFVWRYPRETCLKCGRGGGFCHQDANPFTDRKATKWQKTLLRKGTKAIPWRRVQRVGVVLSPHWVGPIKGIEYPLRKLKVLTLMREALSLCGCSMGDPLYEIRHYPTRLWQP
jgi:hypothetical protein